jgi:two-component system, OmpR family, phosphate regulon sensor histidine kinase PhoR
MFKKNISPQRLSSLIALALAVPISIGSLLLKPSWITGLFVFVFVFAGSYGLILLSVQIFIYRKIKIIYKLISQTKASKREEFYLKNLLPQKSIDEVKDDVEVWAQQRKAEFEILQQNEVFRREFLQNLSHELKTPIFSIQGYIDTLLGGAMNNEAVNTKFLQSAARNVDRLANLVADLDEISKLESGEQKLNFQYFVIQDINTSLFY